MKFRLVTPEKIALETEIDSVTLPTVTGEVTILPHHAALVSQLGYGELTLRQASGEHLFAVSGGFVSVTNDEVEVLAESADHADEIDTEQAEAAKMRAEKLREAANTELEIAEATVALERALAQIKVAQRKRRHHVRTP